MRNALWVFATITAMGVGTTAAATHAARAAAKQDLRPNDPTAPARKARAKRAAAAQSAQPVTYPVTYIERTIPAPVPSPATKGKEQSPTKALSRVDRRQA